jgi:CO dehydrogenase maturation factor
LSLNIAVAGKGGSGKTTIASIIIRNLKKRRVGPVLAVDADPNANLGESLGFDVTHTVGTILAEFQRDKAEIPAGMTKEAYLEYRLHGAILETAGLDLVTMGRGEGADCYCYPNVILRKMIEMLSRSYAFVVMDNEAGMEHLSRGTTKDIDELLIVSDHSVKGVRTIARIRTLVSELGLTVKRQSVIINRGPDKMDSAITAEMARLGIKPAAVIPLDRAVFEFDLKMKPLLDMPDTSPAVRAVDGLMSRLLAGEDKVSPGKKEV